MFTVPFHRDTILTQSISDASTLSNQKTMAELMQQMNDPIHSGSVGSIPQTYARTSSSASSLTFNKALRGNESHSTSSSNFRNSNSSLSNAKVSSSKIYTHGLSNSAGTVSNISTSTSTSANLALLNDISPNQSHFFEVMYVGKIRVTHKRVPFTFIDDALPKFKAYDAQRSRLLQSDSVRRSSLISQDSQDSLENISTKEKSDNRTDKDVDKAEESSTVVSDTGPDKKSFKNSELRIVEESDYEVKSNVKSDSTEYIKKNKQNEHMPKKLLRGQSQLSLPIKKLDENNIEQVQSPSESFQTVSTEDKNSDPIPKQRDRSASYGCIPLVEQNRTMVFLVGRSDLRLISPDRKQVLLYKDFKDIASCAQGHKNPDHFGVICREGSNDGYIGYIFKCQSDHVADDIVAAISQAFITCSEQKNKEKNQIFSCDHCPMLWFHKLCSDIESLSDKKTQSLIFKRIETLTDDEQDIIWEKFHGAEKISSNNLAEQNQFLIMLLRAHCESKQQRHVHDTAENRSEFLNQYLGGSTIFMKAKRSLSNSFDHLLKRKGSRDDFSHAIRESNIIKEIIAENNADENESETTPKSRSNILPGAKLPQEEVKSPMMDIFIKVGNSPKEDETHQGSWRQAILNSVVTPNKTLENVNAEFLSPLRPQQKIGKRTTEELRELWKTAIRQIILLNRMEKENARLQARQNENEIKKIKLDYDEIVPCDKQAAERWDLIIERDSSKIGNKKDPKVLLHAIKNGVPRSKRGEVWAFLAEQHSMNTAPVCTKKFPNFNTPYQTLLKYLTEHQHAIFIDLGRTFPNHKFYKAALGVGQLSLFNLLKAYSILDPELGYCQGLGFICGILLLHCEEEEAFQLLKHLMFRRQMRTKYLPDMQKFQLQLYQLSRLVKDHLPELYKWLDQNDVSPTLYAAPWLLTIFSSQFPLGFVARVFDLLFLESSEVIFKVALSLLAVHKDELMNRDNFEDIMDYLKNVAPKIDADTMNKIMKMVFGMDISKQLIEYQVEYNVLQEEITTSNHHLEALNKEKEQNHYLETQLQFAQSSIAQLERTRSSQQSQITTLQAQVQSLEVTIQTLGHFVSQIVERNCDIDLPTDVRRILQQLDDIEKQRKRPLFIERKIAKSLSVNGNLGFTSKVLKELNERENEVPQAKKNKMPYFENTYEQLKQQRAGQQRPNSLIDSSSPPPVTQYSFSQQSQFYHHESKVPLMKIDEIQSSDNVQEHISNIRSPNDVDSGFGTPLTPSQSEIPQPVTKAILPSNTNDNACSSEMHPLSNCGDVNFRFNGTTQLKSLKPIHSRLPNSRQFDVNIESNAINFSKTSSNDKLSES